MAYPEEESYGEVEEPHQHHKQEDGEDDTDDATLTNLQQPQHSHDRGGVSTLLHHTSTHPHSPTHTYSLYTQLVSS